VFLRGRGILAGMRLETACTFLLAAALAACPGFAQTDPIDKGHSAHGAAFDIGPRQKPWLMEGIGAAPFPITTKNPEVQQWFNQGNALLHSFWFYEAERSFRWCLKLEPDNAMAYWGLARATDGDRAADFVREAVKRKDKVTERERLYIEALEAAQPDPVRDAAAKPDYRELRHREMKKLETLCVKYPDDMEARALLAEVTLGDSRYGAELIIREILARQPNHPGAHHYRIHNWDYHEPEQALASCRAYSDLVPGIGHAQHMPGHIYAIVGMWHEAALSMDAATRVEKQYMRTSLTFPFNNWNYAHNRNYLGSPRLDADGNFKDRRDESSWELWQGCAAHYAPKLTETDAVEVAAKAIYQSNKEKYWPLDFKDAKAAIQISIRQAAKSALRAAGVRFIEGE